MAADKLSQPTDPVARPDQEASKLSMNEELARFKPTAAENKRVLIISLFYLFVAVFIGVPVWLRTTATYQAPLPFWAIKALCSRPIQVQIPMDIISFSETLLPDDLAEIQTQLTESVDPSLRCGSIQHTTVKLKVDCDVRTRLATEPELQSYTHALSNSLSFNNFLNTISSELFGDCSSAAQLSQLENQRYSCPSDSSLYTLVVLPQKLPSLFNTSEVASNFVQRSAHRNLLYIVEPFADTKSEGRRRLASQIAVIINSVLLPVTEIEHLTAPSSAPTQEEGSLQLTYSRVPSSSIFSKARQLPPSTDYDITVTIITHAGDASVEFPQGVESVSFDWAYQLLLDPTPWIQSQLEEVFTSWLPNVRFHFSSQRLHAVDTEQLGHSRLSEDYTYRYYTADDLSNVVNQLESFLGAPQTASAATRDMAGTKPGLHLILLLAMPLNSGVANDSSSSCPLPLKFLLPTPSGESTLTDVAVVPQWGGLFSVGAPSPCTQHGRNAALVKGQLITVIRLLLGLSETTQSMVRFNPAIPSPGRFGKVDHWELDSWFLRRTVESLLSIRMTMTALVDLLSRFPNMVVNDYVASEVTLSANMWAQTLDDLRSVRHLSNTTGFGGIFSRAQDSLSSVDSAFFDHTLLGRLYFQNTSKDRPKLISSEKVFIGEMRPKRPLERALFSEQVTLAAASKFLEYGLFRISDPLTCIVLEEIFAARRGCSRM
ncbi:phosphatidylinositol glycan class S [Clonorchis sinensis]|uniref:Phosphatidylinositol glycan class S n=1 Tax=Clonorchis sinensis TaxID=79923 RepID=H2KSR8_CLOSI|nr:phosphatidylinositol glycan class S [Clonorchis sinensis]